ncbi:unnamed protein product [Symbiodinium sp. CCMP2592]|nr:unnamed protein product [Symbiodinium sp. CCMP2592]
MRRHAENVAKDGVYLDVLDVMLCARLHAVDLRLVLNMDPEATGESTLESVSAGAYLEGLSGWRIREPEECTMTSVIALTRADFEPAASPAELNHFIPCWTAGEKPCEEEVERLREWGRDMRHCFLQQIAECDDATLPHTEAARDVGADGNCGVWSILGLLKGSPFMAATSDQATLSEMRSVRQQISESWCRLAGDSRCPRLQASSWCRIFDIMLPGDIGDAGDASSPSTPVKRCKQEPSQDFKCFEQLSPPKVSATALRATAAGLVRPRSETGPSVPLKLERADPATSTANILGDLRKPQQAKSRKPPACSNVPEFQKIKKAPAAPLKSEALVKQEAADDDCAQHKAKRRKTGQEQQRLVDKLVDGSMPAQVSTPGQTDNADGQQIVSAPQDAGEPQPVSDTEAAEQAGSQGEDEQQPAEQDVRQLILKDPYLRMLPEGSLCKRFPVECSLCVRATTRKKAVFDLVSLERTKFYYQHVQSATHRRHLAAREGGNSSRSSAGAVKSSRSSAGAIGAGSGAGAATAAAMEDEATATAEPPALKCQGFHVQKAPPEAKLASLLPAFELWAVYNQLNSGLHQKDARKHQYQHDMTTGHFILRHYDCQADEAYVPGPDVPALCEKCRSLGNDRCVLRMVQRFYVKHCGARLLAAKLFDSDDVEPLTQEIRASPVYQCAARSLEALLELDRAGLQQFVRAQFLSTSPSSWSAALADFISAVVRPCLKVSVTNWNKQVATSKHGSVRALADRLRHRTLSSIEDIELKLACAVAGGVLHQHPVIQGILVAAVEQAQRAARGKSGFRSHKLCELELSLMAEVGVAISMAANNGHLLKQFGLAFAVPKAPLDNLHGANLPEPFLALRDPAMLQENTLIIDSQFGCTPPDAPKTSARSWVLAFDLTYLVRGLDVVKLRQGKGFIGSAFHPSSLASRSALENGPEDAMDKMGTGFMALKDTEASSKDTEATSNVENTDTGIVDASRVDYAKQVLEFLVWKPALQKLPRFSLCCIPLAYDYTAKELLTMVGHVLESCNRIKCIVFDNASTHHLVKSLLVGQPISACTSQEWRQMPFWRRLTFESLPDCCLPRWPFRIPRIEGEAVYGLNGPAHIQKNFVGQCRSPARTLHFGSYWADWTSCLDLCMPPGSYQGFDLQSDLEAATFLNAYHLITELTGEISEVKVPWALTGALLLNHELSAAQRLENAMTSFILLDLGDMLAREMCVQRNLPKGSLWLHKTTQGNLQQLAGLVSIACCTLVPGTAWLPWRSTELHLEQFFGYLRSQYSSSQMSMRDYLYASSRQMQQTSMRLKHNPPQPVAYKAEASVSAEEYAACARRALDAALLLTECCSVHSKPKLLKSYIAYCTQLMQDNPEPADMGAGLDIGDEVTEENTEDFPEDVEHPPDNLQQADMTAADAECLQLLAQVKAREIADEISWQDPKLPEVSAQEAQRLGTGKQPLPEALDKESWEEVTAEKDAEPVPLLKDARSGKILTLFINLAPENAGIYSTCLCEFHVFLLFLGVSIFVPKT